MKRLALGILIISLWGSSAQARLEGQLRDNYLAIGQKNCRVQQHKDPVNKGVSDNLLNAYCFCAISYIADNSTPDQIILVVSEIKRNGKSDWLTDKQKKASEYCIANLDSYVKQ